MAQGSMAMGEPGFVPLSEESSDDLPRTFRREKEARAREARERAAQERAAAPTLSTAPEKFAPERYASESFAPAQSASGLEPRVKADPQLAPALAEMPYPASVRRFDVPFMHLVTFFLKAVVAAIPALILLSAILWGMGTVLQGFFPSLVKLKILIGFQG